MDASLYNPDPSLVPRDVALLVNSTADVVTLQFRTKLMESDSHNEISRIQYP